MKKIWLAVVMASFFFSASSPGEMTGREVMERQRDVQSADTEYGEEIMMIRDLRAGTHETRNARRFAKETEDGLSRSLFVFLSPAGIAGTAVLTWEREGVDDDQWVYMPATGRMQRIASGSKRNYFMGTDFTHEDMAPEDIDNFNYTITGTETLTVDDKEWTCRIVEAVPAHDEKRRESGYSRRLMWIDTEHFVTLKVEFYDRRNRLMKTQTVYELEPVIGTIWRAKRVMMDNPSRSSQTLSMVTRREINEWISDDVFTERFITSGRHTR